MIANFIAMGMRFLLNNGRASRHTPGARIALRLSSAVMDERCCRRLPSASNKSLPDLRSEPSSATSIKPRGGGSCNYSYEFSVLISHRFLTIGMADRIV